MSNKILLRDLKRDFNKFSKAFNWYNIFRVRGQPYVTSYNIGTQRWRFTEDYFTICNYILRIKVNAFLRGVENGHVKGFDFIIDNCYDEFMTLIKIRYPQLINVDWYKIKNITNHPIICEIFYREKENCWKFLVHNFNHNMIK